MSKNGKSAKHCRRRSLGQCLSSVVLKIVRPAAAAGRHIGNAFWSAGCFLGRVLHPVTVHLEPVARLVSVVFDALYMVSYFVGIQTLRFSRSVNRRIVHLFRPLGRQVYRLADFLLLRHARALASGIRAEAVRFARGFPVAFSRVRDLFKEHPARALLFVALLPFITIRRHRRALLSMFNVAAPIAAAVVLVFTINHYSSLSFALAVNFNGDDIGYIADESVYDAAANMAYGRVLNTDNSFEITRAPSMTVRIVDKAELMDENAICDEILKSSGDAIKDASGLYVDGIFEAAVESRGQLESALNSILDEYRQEGADEEIAFVQDVQIVDGLYPVSTIQTASAIRSSMVRPVTETRAAVISRDGTAEELAEVLDTDAVLLTMLNAGISEFEEGDEVVYAKNRPYLQVKVIRVEMETEVIPYEKTTKKSDTYLIGYENVTQKGVDGEVLNTVEYSFVDGEVIGRRILESAVTKEAVAQITVLGDKRINSSANPGDGIATNRFIWPIPGCYTISSSFGSRSIGYHNGIDLTGGAMGKPVIAADGGKVIHVGWQYPNSRRSGLGQYIVIDHGNGYKTYYAHLDSYNVEEGDMVAQGEMIGRAGNTGRSDGPHLHFEIRLNGTPINPYKYIINNK